MAAEWLTWRRDDAASAVPGAHWSSFARIWDRIRPPLRPSTEDVACYAGHITEWARRHGPPRGLILGVTPELCRLPWPEGSAVTAVDRSADMIERVWPGPRESAIRADWSRLPCPDASIDVALCDAGFVQLSYPHQASAVVRSLRRVVRPEGLCLVRLCVPPDRPESPRDVLDEWRSGGIPNASVLKLRLGMSLQADSRTGVPLARIWQSLDQAAGDGDGMASVPGWTAEEASTLASYQNNPARYRFLTLSEVEELFLRRPGGFVVTSVTQPSYLLGDRCPLAVFRRKEW